MTYRDHGTNLPAFQTAVFTDGDRQWQEEETTLKWSGTATPPAIGSTVKVTMNGLGFGRVTGYFEDCGWLGLKVKFIDPPAWYTKQNGTTPGHIFGAEIE